MPCLHSKKPKGRAVLCSIQSGPGLQNSARFKCYILLSQLSFQVASFCHRTAVAARGFTFWLLLLKGIRGAPFHHHLLRVKTFPGGSPFLNASLWVSWAWMVSFNALLNTGRGVVVLLSFMGQLWVHLKPRLPLPDGVSFTQLGDWLVHTGLLMPTSCWNATPPSGCLFPQGHAPYLAWTLTLHPLAIPMRLLQKLERLWILSMGPLHAPMSLSPSSDSDTPAPITPLRLTAYPVTVCLNKS